MIGPTPEGSKDVAYPRAHWSIQTLCPYFQVWGKRVAMLKEMQRKIERNTIKKKKKRQKKQDIRKITVLNSTFPCRWGDTLKGKSCSRLHG